MNLIYLNTYSKPTKSIAYTSTIYDLIDFAKHQREKFICLDVDICNQLLAFNQEMNKYSEPFFFLDPPTYTDSFNKLSGNFNAPNNFLYVAHSESNSHFPIFRQSFFNYLRDYKINYMKIKEFKDGEKIAFEIFKIGKPSLTNE